MSYREVTGDQARHAINVEQAFAAYSDARDTHERSFTGSMSWKTVSGRQYLYRKRQGTSASLGPRSPDTEKIHRRFLVDRLRSRIRVLSLVRRLDELAPVSRALSLGRVPVMAARILRQLNKAKLTNAAITVVGTNALFAYERLTGVQITSDRLATDDIDLLFDARARLKILTPDVAETGVVGLLKKVDRSFELQEKNGFRAVNRDGYMVDLIAALPRDRMKAAPRDSIGSLDSDLRAVGIEGLNWLVNSPKITAIVIDERGYPLQITAPDPRAFALHKSWVAKRADRDPYKRPKDIAQVELLATLITTRLPHLRFDDPVLNALPLALRNEANALTRTATVARDETASLTPDW